MKLMCLSPQRKKEQESLLSSSTGKNHWHPWWNVGRSSANGMVWLMLCILSTCLAGREISVSISVEFCLYTCRQPVGGGGCTGTPFPVLQGITKRCRLSLPTNSALVIRFQMRGKVRSCGVSASE
jgi:hypothetical protein